MDVPYHEPRNEIEKQITAVWERILGVKPVGIEDSFFELGRRFVDEYADDHGN